MPKYRAPELSVDIVITMPTIAALAEITMCQQCSIILPEDQETMSVAKYANT
jgi:hypothetical protein